MFGGTLARSTTFEKSAATLFRQGSPISADRVREHPRARIERLITRPFIGVLTSHPEIRILPPTRYPYRIYYTIQSDDVVILHIRHSARSEPDDLRI